MIDARRFVSDWRWFPFAMIGMLAAVFGVNAVMVYAALTTFPGQAGQDGFDLSNAYDRVLELSGQQAALGWHVGVELGPGRHPMLHVTDRTGAPLADPVVAVRAERPLGPKQEVALTMSTDGPGLMVSQQTLQAGRWTLFVTVTQGADTLSMTGQLAMP